MDETPFPHYGPLEAQGVTGREEEAADLIGRLLERRPVALVGPRRYGKTSLVRHALWRLDEVQPTSAVWVDLYGVTSAADLAVRLDQALVAARGPIPQVLATIPPPPPVQLP